MADVTNEQIKTHLENIQELLQAIAGSLNIRPEVSPPTLDERVIGYSAYGGVKLARVVKLKERLMASSDEKERQFAKSIGDFHFVADYPGLDAAQVLQVNQNLSAADQLLGWMRTQTTAMFASLASVFVERKTWRFGPTSFVPEKALPDHNAWARPANGFEGTTSLNVYERCLESLERFKADGTMLIMSQPVAVTY